MNRTEEHSEDGIAAQSPEKGPSEEVSLRME